MNEGVGLPFHDLCTFIKHIKESISTMPHVQVAYTWVFYMALFSGGRYIRAKLLSAGDGFWTTALEPGSLKNASTSHDVDSDELETVPLSFWNFSGAFDGDHLKASYKSRVQEIEPFLTVKERQDIVEEAVFIMKKLLIIVTGIELVVTN